MIGLYPKPPVPRPNSKRLSKRKPMTIAIGMRFDGGLLLGTDTEMTQGNIKTSESKIVEHSFGNTDAKCIFAVAGLVSYATMAIDKIVQDITVSGNFSFAEMERIIKADLFHMFRNQMWPHPHYEKGDHTFNLLVAIWSKQDGLHLLACEEDAVNEVSQFECFGIGLSLAKYLLKPIYECAKSYSDYSLVARYVIEEVKNTVPYCGKNTEVRIVLNDGSSPTPMQPFAQSVQEKTINDFWQKARQIMILAADENISNETLTEEFEVFRKNVLANRQFLGWKIITGGQTCEPWQGMK